MAGKYFSLGLACYHNSEISNPETLGTLVTLSLASNQLIRIYVISSFPSINGSSGLFLHLGIKILEPTRIVR